MINPVMMFALKNMAKSAKLTVEEKELDPVADRAALEELIGKAAIAGKKVRVVVLGQEGSDHRITLLGLVNPGMPQLKDGIL